MMLVLASISLRRIDFWLTICVMSRVGGIGDRVGQSGEIAAATDHGIIIGALQPID